MENIVKTEQLYEGKAKKVFATNNPDYVIVDYKDDATAFNGEKKGTIRGKGVVNNKMTNYMFGLLEKEGIPTHLVKEINDRETIVKKVEIVPLEVIVRNVAAGNEQAIEIIDHLADWYLRWTEVVIFLRSLARRSRSRSA